jgi:hypothetical protein
VEAMSRLSDALGSSTSSPSLVVRLVIIINMLAINNHWSRKKVSNYIKYGACLHRQLFNRKCVATPIRFYPCKQYVTKSIKKFVCTYSTQYCILIIY